MTAVVVVTPSQMGSHINNCTYIVLETQISPQGSIHGQICVFRHPTNGVNAMVLSIIRDFLYC